MREQGKRQLAQHRTKTRKHHIEGKYTAALVVFSLLVQPAFKHHELGHHGYARDETQPQPDPQIIDERQRQNGDGYDGSRCCVGPYMAHLNNDLVPQTGTEHQTQVINGNEATHPDFRHRVGGKTQRHVGVEQTRTHQQQQCCQVQGKESGDHLHHKNSTGQKNETRAQTRG